MTLFNPMAAAIRFAALGRRPWPALAWCLAAAALVALQSPRGAGQAAERAAPFEIPEPDEDAPQPDAAPAAPADPLVEQLLALNLRTPEQLIRALAVLLDLRHPEAGGPLWEKLAALELDDAERERLMARFGRATLERLAREPAWQAQAGPFVAALVEASKRAARDPQRLEQALATLAQTARERADLSPRLGALRVLVAGGDDAVELAAGVLADPQAAARHAAAAQALEAIGPAAVPALTAMLAADDPAIQQRAVDVLARIPRPEVALYLLEPALAPDRATDVCRAAADAVRRLEGQLPGRQQAAARLYTRAQAQTRDPRDTLAPTTAWVWRWDASASRPVRAEISSRTARLEAGLRLAEAAHRLAPEHPAIARLRLASALEWADSQVAGHEPLADGPSTPRQLALASGETGLADLVEYGLASDRPALVARAAELLGEVARPGYVSSRAAQPCGLVRALGYPDRRARFAALEALLRIAPTTPYPGSSFVPQTLAWFAAAGGAPQAVIAHPRADEAGRLAGLLAELGYEPHFATDGRTLAARAVAAPDCQLALISTALGRPTAADTLALLRRDPRTARLPVAIVAADDASLTAARRLARADRHAAAWVRPLDAAGAGVQLEHWTRDGGLEPTSADDRRRQGAQALVWLAELAAAPEGLYDLSPALEAVERAMFAIEHSAAAVSVLSATGTPRAQRTLVDLASLTSLPLEVRQNAAAGFAQSVARFGILLTSGEMLRQYDRYNHSERLDRATQVLLGSILDALESRWPDGRPSASPNPSP